MLHTFVAVNSSLIVQVEPQDSVSVCAPSEVGKSACRKVIASNLASDERVDP